MRTRIFTGAGAIAVVGVVSFSALAAAIGGCAGDPNAKSRTVTTDATVAILPEPKLITTAVGTPEELPGVDTSKLNAREREAYWRWVSQLYAPCPQIAASIADCVKLDGACAACVPAARFLAERARAGAPSNEAMAAFQLRFSADVKKVDLLDSPVRGPASAPVTVIVWSDYECPACGFAVPFLEEIQEKHPNDVRIVHKLYPLSTHPHSRQAARAALAAQKQGKYWEMEKLLFENQKSLEDSDLEGYAKKVGLDMARYKRDYADKAAEDVIDRDRADADKHGLSGTPFILINGREFDLSFFKLGGDLESWITTEIEITRKDAERRAVAAVGAALTGEGRGPVPPVGTGVPAASGASTAPAPSASTNAGPSSAPPAVPAEPKAAPKKP